jgi:hypothetical protein
VKRLRTRAVRVGAIRHFDKAIEGVNLLSPFTAMNGSILQDEHPWNEHSSQEKRLFFPLFRQNGDFPKITPMQAKSGKKLSTL